MKTNIHPQFFVDTVVTCACGNTFTTGSTKKSINVEVCYKCHPLYTGEQRFIDVKGRVDTFKKKQQFAATYKATHKSKKDRKKMGDEKRTKSLRELLGEN